MNYESLSKSQLWALVKTAQETATPHSAVTLITWQSAKEEMVRVLNEQHSAPPRVNSTLEQHDSEVPTPQNNVHTVDAVHTDKDVWSDWDALVSEVVPDTHSATHTATIVPSPVQKISTFKQVVHTSDTKHVRGIQQWHYIDHELSGGYKPVTDGNAIEEIEQFLEALNQKLKPVQKFNYHHAEVSIKMKPSRVAVENANGKERQVIEKKAQRNNDYGNRDHTIMSTNETAGRNVGQQSVKESILFQPAQIIAASYRRKNGEWNFKAIATIAINGIQVYPRSISSGLSEKIVPDSLNKKVTKRRATIADKKTEQRGFVHTRSKINNGLSPSWKENGQNFCLQIDSSNRVQVWQLAGDVGHTVSASDLVKGRMLQDVGYVEVKPYVQTQFKNITLDLVRGGQEARLERFDWIAAKLNTLVEPSDNNIKDLLISLTTRDGQPLPIENLRVKDAVISGKMYGSQLLIVQKEVQKHLVVFHPTVKAGENFKAIAYSWIVTLGGKTLSDGIDHTYKHRGEVLGIRNVSSKTLTSTWSNGVKTERISISRKEDAKYLMKLITKFSTIGIFADKEKTHYIGTLVKTDGSAIDTTLIERIVERILEKFPVGEKLATHFTPSHASNSQEWELSFLRLLKVYGEVELAIKFNTTLKQWNDGNEVLNDWCRDVYHYLKYQRVAADTLTIGGAIEMLERTAQDRIKDVYLNLPKCVDLNRHLLLTHYQEALPIQERTKFDFSEHTQGNYVNRIKSSIREDK